MSELLLTKDQILKANDLPTEDVPVPEWGGTVRLRTLMGTERDEFEAGSLKGKGKNREVNLANLRARLVGLCITDAAGNRLFDDSDIRALGRKSSKALARVFEACQKLNGLGDDDVEELAEGFDNAQSDASTSD